MRTNRPTATPPAPEHDHSIVLSPALAAVRDAIVNCEACARLRTYCARVGRQRCTAFRDHTYWARPVPGFGDPAARIILIGLAPAAHGANRTGRLFTGDVPGGASDFLMNALHACGLASQPYSRAMNDGLTLSGVWMSSAVRCAPPDNKPAPTEVKQCLRFLEAELAALPHDAVVVALGRLAFDVALKLLPGSVSRRPLFEHGGVYRRAGGRILVASYHPSRQNTRTGRLTQPMLRQALRRARALAPKP